MQLDILFADSDEKKMYSTIIWLMKNLNKAFLHYLLYVLDFPRLAAYAVCSVPHHEGLSLCKWKNHQIWQKKVKKIVKYIVILMQWMVFFPIGHFIKNMIWHNRRIFAKYRIYKLMFFIKKKFLDKKKKKRRSFISIFCKSYYTTIFKAYWPCLRF